MAAYEVLRNAPTPESDRRALEALVVDNSDLERLEALLSQFNLFEALGIIRQELRHSDFLAYLLNPSQSHGLGDSFAKRLLQRSLVALPIGTAPINPIDLDVWSLNSAQVLREWENIDILLLDNEHQMVVLIENRIDSSEHSNQLQRYRESIQQHYSGWRLICLFLTLDGDSPTDDTFIPISYNLICGTLESLLASHASILGSEVIIAIQHYTQMLRRHVVDESEIAELCRRIYQKHQRALDLIYEHRPDRQATIRSQLDRMIKDTPTVVLDGSSKGAIRFCPELWTRMPELRAGAGWTSSGMIPLFEFSNTPDNLRLKLLIGPGSQEIRQRLFDAACQHQPPFRITDKKLYPRWTTIYSRVWLAAKSLDASESEAEDEIRKHWRAFIDGDLESIQDLVAQTISQGVGGLP